MQRDFFDTDHEDYRKSVREFVAREVAENAQQWDDDGLIDRSMFRAAAEAGVYGLEIPEAYGGSGTSDYRFRVVVNEELLAAHAHSVNITLALQDDLVLHYLVDLATEEQQRRWLPGFARGELVGSLAMSEPGAGSDLRGLRTTAKATEDGWVLNGQKTFISCGTSSDLIIVAARDDSVRSGGLTLLVVEADMPGFSRGRKLRKVGLHGQDTAELFFDQVEVPRSNLLGSVGEGMRHLREHLVRERLGTTVAAVAGSRAVFAETVRYCGDRQAFGQPIGDFQNTRFTLAEIATELDVAQTYADRQVLAFNDGQLDAVDAAKGKWWATDLQKRVIDRCLQLHGGYGYMLEYPVARAFVDTRVQTIYGGTNEIMKEIIGRDLARAWQD
jgi:alkylation response protein AidB-like acyl-CoA dehydrogenase